MARRKAKQVVGEDVRPPKVGVMSNLFRGSPTEVAELCGRYGLNAVQIVPSFADGAIRSGNPVETEVCRRMGEPFVAADITVAGVNCYLNWLDSDAARRKRLIAHFDAMVDHCQDFGTKHVVTETGTLNEESPWSDCPENHRPEAVEAFCESIGPSVKLAEQAGVKVVLKGYLYHVVGSVELARQIHERFGPTVAFVMDPANYFTRNMVNASTSFLRRMFEQMADFCPIAHGKDVRYVGGALTTPRTGTGNLDYREFLELLDQRLCGAPLILEQIRPEELRETLDFLDRFFE